jgi:tetratricopeptide (TPR) repeat protein
MMVHPRTASALALTAALLLPACVGGQAGTRESNASAATPDDDAQAAVLLKARAALDAKRPAETIEYADQIIAHYERAHPPKKGRVYCARSQREVLFYMLTATKNGENAVAIGPTWVGAYYLKAFALVELGNVTAARDALERARILSPQNSQLLSELAYVHQISGDHANAFAMFLAAEEAAEFSPDDGEVADATRALRGQGFILTDNGHLDEAEAKYRKCLELNPDDADAKRELDYIAKIRRR